MNATRIMLRMVKVGGPQPLYDVEWTRTYRIVLEDGRIMRRVQVRGVNHKGYVSMRPTRWKAIGRLREGETVSEYKAMLETIGFREVTLAGKP